MQLFNWCATEAVLECQRYNNKHFSSPDDHIKMFLPLPSLFLFSHRNEQTSFQARKTRVCFTVIAGFVLLLFYCPRITVQLHLHFILICSNKIIPRMSRTIQTATQLVGQRECQNSAVIIAAFTTLLAFIPHRSAELRTGHGEQILVKQQHPVMHDGVYPF